MFDIGGNFLIGREFIIEQQSFYKQATIMIDFDNKVKKRANI